MGRRKRPYEALYNSLVRKSVRDGKDISLTYEDFLELTCKPHCTYCRAVVTWAEYYLHGNSHRYNLDRLDNSRGYHKDNIVVCCWDCNQMKGSRLTHEEMLAAMEAILLHRQTTFI